MAPTCGATIRPAPGDLGIWEKARAAGTEQAFQDYLGVCEFCDYRAEVWKHRAWNEPHTGEEFVWVPGGCFQMGQTDAEKRYLLGLVSREDYDK